MNRVVQEQPAGDGLDALLATFFRRELPDPWPGFRAPACRADPPQPRLPVRRPWRGSRLALAASVGLLAATATLLPGNFAGRAPGFRVGTLGPGTAGKPVLPSTEPAPAKVKSELFLEQDKDGPTGIRVNVEGEPPNR
jgi:hypothetical protein